MVVKALISLPARCPYPMSHAQNLPVHTLGSFKASFSSSKGSSKGSFKGSFKGICKHSTTLLHAPCRDPEKTAATIPPKDFAPPCPVTAGVVAYYIVRFLHTNLTTFFLTSRKP